MQALIFGKFLPFHKGHQAMIEFACTQCDVLQVLVCKSDKEQISGEKRQHWIAQTFQHTANIKVSLLLTIYIKSLKSILGA